MTSALSSGRAALRSALAAALTDAGISAYSVQPETFTPPAVFVGPGQPYLTRTGAAFGGEVVNLDVTVVVEAGLNDHRADELDALIEQTLDALYALEGAEGFEWLTTRDVTSPGPITINGQSPFLAASIAVSTEIHRG